MFFPYLRGRQYELLALKELANGGLLGKSIIPVVEPIKLTATFDGFIKSFVEAQLPVAVLFNPTVGELTDASSVFEKLYSRCFDNGNVVIPSLLINRNAEDIFSLLLSKMVSKSNVLAVLDNRDLIEVYKVLFSNNAPKYTLCPDERQIRRAVTQNKVLFENKFN